MLTDTQKKTFDKIKNIKLSPKQKADFYYRMSNIMKTYLEGIGDLVYLLNEIPDSYQEKIDFARPAADAMCLCETILQKMSLPTVEADYHRSNIKAVKKFDLGDDNQKLPPEYPFTIIGCSITRNLTENEACLINREIEHMYAMEALLIPKREKMSAQDFNARVQPSIYAAAEEKGIQCRTDWNLVEEPAPLKALLDYSVNRKKRKAAEDMMIRPPPE